MTAVDQCDFQTWFHQMAVLRTEKHLIQNIGWSLILASLALAVIKYLFLRQKFVGLPQWRTPSRKWHFFAYGIALLAISYIGSIYGLSLDQSRDMFPWCSDSIAIPIYQMMLGFPILLIFLLIAGGLLSLNFGKLPVGLLQWDDNNIWKSWFVSISFGIIFLALLYATMDTAVISDFVGVFAGVLAMYLTLATRAALLAPRPGRSEK